MNIVQWYARLWVERGNLGEGQDQKSFGEAHTWWWDYHAFDWGTNGRPSRAGPPALQLFALRTRGLAAMRGTTWLLNRFLEAERR